MIRAAAWRGAVALLSVLPMLGRPANAGPPTLDSVVCQTYDLATQTGKVLVTGKWDRWPADLAAEGQAVRFEPLAAKGEFEMHVDSDASRGVRLVRLIDHSGASKPLPLVVPTTGEIREMEPNNELADAQQINGPSVTINGRLDRAGDVDVFALGLKRGQTFVASLMAHEVFASPVDAVLQLVDGDGFVCAQNNDFLGLDPRIIFTVPRDGMYRVRLFAFASEPNSSIAFSGGGPKAVYRLTLTTEGFLDYAFPLGVEADKPAGLQLLGWNIPEKLGRWQLSPEAPGQPLIITQPGMAGFATVDVVDHPAIVESEPPAPGTARTIVLPITLSGRIDPPGDTDTYRFSARKSELLKVRLASRSLGFPLDAVIQVRNSQGKVLTQLDDVKNDRDPTISYRIPGDGEYEVVVSDLTQQGGPRYAYRLTIEFWRPEFQLSATAAAWNVSVAKPTVIPVTVERTGGFDEPVELSVVEQPAGIMVVPLDAPAKNSKSIRLEIRAAAGAKSGTISIRGKSSTSGRTSWLSAPADYGTKSTTNLWVSVLRP